MNYLKIIIQKYLFLTSLFTFLLFSLTAQIRLDIEGDAKIRGSIDLIQATGDSSIFIGANAGINNDGTDNRNVFIGKGSGKTNTVGQENVFIGNKTGTQNLSGYGNTFLGTEAGRNNITGKANIFIGHTAGATHKVGDRNVFIGLDSGAPTGGNNTYCTFLGAYTGIVPNSGDSLDRAIAIGYDAKVTCNNCAVIGGTGEDAVKVGIGTSTPIYTFDVQHVNGAPSSSPGNGLNIKNLAGNNNEWQLYVGNINGKLRLYKNGVLRGTFDEVSGNYTPSSDRRLKNNVQSLENQLALINRLRPTSYHFNGRKTERKVYGLIAQEVQKIIPDIVLENEADNPAMKTLGISYTELIPILIAGMQEQQTIIQVQQTENLNQGQQLAKLLKKIESLETSVNELQNSYSTDTDKQQSPKIGANQYQLSLKKRASIAQNQPNPFHHSTQMNYFLPANTQKALIRVSAINGEILGETPLLETGEGQITIQTRDYPAGTYYYSLMIDGRIMETKKMVLMK